MTMRKEFDTTILLLAVVLTCLGVVMVYSSSSIVAAKRYSDGFYFLKRQGIFALLGFAVMAVAMQIDYHRLRPLAVPFLLGCVALMVLVLIPGISSRAGGASRWIRLPGFSLQPSELAKLGLVFYMAHSLAKKKEKIKSFKFGFIPYMVVLALLLLLLLLQPDLGSAITLGGVAMVMLLVAGTRLVYLASLGILSVPFLYFLVMDVAYRRKRILAFLNPWKDPTNTGFQIIQSWIAFGTGGLFGNGLGEGKQKLFYLPEPHTDFIFSVIGEELGLVGVLIILGLYSVILWKGISIARNSPDAFGSFVAVGLTTAMGLQIFINMGVALGLLPTKGLTLPFLSYGGTSLLMNMASIGVLMNISGVKKMIKAGR